MLHNHWHGSELGAIPFAAELNSDGYLLEGYESEPAISDHGLFLPWQERRQIEEAIHSSHRGPFKVLI